MDKCIDGGECCDLITSGKGHFGQCTDFEDLVNLCDSDSCEKDEEPSFQELLED